MERRPDQDLIPYKALQLVYNFHALSYPEMHPDSVIAGDAVSQAAPDLVDAGTVWVFDETKVKDRTVDVAERAKEIKQLFVPVMRKVWQVGQDPYAALLDYCQEQIDNSEAGEDLRDRQGRAIQAVDILPSATLVLAMHRSWVEGSAVHCKELEEYIIQLEDHRTQDRVA